MAILSIGGLAKAQDVIVKNDKTEIKTKVIELTEDLIKYKKFEMLEGPIYSIKKADVFMIIYENGTKEYMQTQKPKEEPVAASPTKVDAPTANASNTTSGSSGNPYDADFNILKGGSRYGNIGVAFKNFSTYTIPTVVITYDFIVANNVSVGYHYSANYLNQSTSFSGINITTSAINMTIGLRANYYLNHVLKLDPEKAQFYAGVTPYMLYSTISTESNSRTVASGSDSKTKFSVLGQIGGRYFFSRKIGIYTDMFIGESDVDFSAGIAIRIIK
jgi:hypothetical protein